MINSLLLGDCVETMRRFPANTFDAICTDPPYGLEFMGKEWDRLWDNRANTEYRRKGFGPGVLAAPVYEAGAKAQEWHYSWTLEALRVLKPGGHMVAMGGTRTHHRLWCAVEDAGFEVRDCLMWLYGSGFPKSLDVSKAIDKAAGAKREVVRAGFTSTQDTQDVYGAGLNANFQQRQLTAPATDAARQWQGWGTALKPSYEPILLCRKPIERNVAHNVQRYSTGALNIDACRTEYQSDEDKASATPQGRCTAKAGALAGKVQHEGDRTGFQRPEQRGRWPANLVLDEEAAAMLDAQSGESVSGIRQPSGGTILNPETGWNPNSMTDTTVRGHGDSGGASRYFFVCKVDDRDSSMYNGVEETGVGQPCGHENTKVAATSAGRKRASSTESLRADGFGSRPTGRFLPATISIIEMETNSTIIFPILNLSSDRLIGVCIIDAEKPTELLMASSIVSVSVADSGEALIITNDGRQEPIRAIARIVSANNSESGESKTENATTPICGSTDAANAKPRFFYTSKAGPDERGGSKHPTVKPRDLMLWLCRLITPPGGLILDPFIGSGTTAVAAKMGGFRCVGIDNNEEYLSHAAERLRLGDVALCEVAESKKQGAEQGVLW